MRLPSLLTPFVWIKATIWWHKVHTVHLKTFSVLYSTWECAVTCSMNLDLTLNIERGSFTQFPRLISSVPVGPLVLIETHYLVGCAGILGSMVPPSIYSLLVLTLHLQSNPAPQRRPETVLHRLRLMLQFPVNTRWHVWLHPPWEGDMFAGAMYSYPLSAAECLNEDIYYNRDTED